MHGAGNAKKPKEMTNMTSKQKESKERFILKKRWKILWIIYLAIIGISIIGIFVGIFNYWYYWINV